jgi:type VI secretion system protein ImpF
MARSEFDSIVTLSVLDRLIDHEPQERMEQAMTRSQSVRALKQSLRRDLEWLLNTRRIPEPAGEQYPETGRSVYDYGFPDFSTFSFANIRDRQRLVKTLEATIRLFEPRLDSVRIIPIDAEGDSLVRAVRFQIEGMLLMDPAPEQIAFDTVLSLTTGEYQVKGGA